MKTTKLSALITATGILSASSQTLTSAFFSNADFTVHEESAPGVIIVNNSFDPVQALQGSLGAAGGNVELFRSSDLAPFDDPSAGGLFASADATVLTAGFSDSSTVTVSGLNGQDWFVDASDFYDTAFGADNLANQWFGDFLDAVIDQSNGAVLPFVTGNESDLFDNFRDNGGFAQLSDPNISFIDTSDSFVSVGLAGFDDSTTRLAGLLGVNSFILGQFFPDGIQVSEVARVNGREVYSFEAIDSGVVLDDGVDSFSGTFVVTVPEPSSALFLLVAGGLVSTRRKR